ncbi:hypothetical protein DICVIV_09490 [Dictyocaulus viviparus]|uniref:Nuclear pore complex protein n=1 Tax=Dictyocaulus viviparus TaxID=29172 RepID=A0A0D8XL17_DICVI|nr:hypothetical protein DICVIV_09490 [Dictyocaulus viviparus]
MKGINANGCSFTELDDAVWEDVHAALTRLSCGEFEYNAWSDLAKIFRDYHDALEYLGNQVTQEEIQHARSAYRCLTACITEAYLKNDYVNNKDDSLLAALIAEDEDFRIIYVLWQWCIECATESNGFTDLLHQIKDMKTFIGSARSDIKRMMSTEAIADDPDSILNAAEDPGFEKLVRVVFSLLRCGRFDEAIELSNELSIPWMALLIHQQRLMIDEKLFPAQLTEREQATLVYRELAFQMMANNKYTRSVRMVFATLVGDWKFLVPLANNFEDRLWCYANAAVQAKLNFALGLKHPIYTPTSAEGIFEALITADTSPYHVVMSFMVQEAWIEAAKWMSDYVNTIEAQSTTRLSSLYRFFGLVMSVCHIMKYVQNEDHEINLIGKMIDVLRHKMLFGFIPFYAALLPKDDALKRIWNTMSYIKTEKDRCAFIKALKEAKFDGEDIAIEFGRFRALEDVDHLDFLRWIFVCSDENLIYAIAEANAVVRHYLLLDMEAEASNVINECENYKIIDRLVALVKNTDHGDESQFDDLAELVINEFNNHHLYLSALAHCTTFAVECAKLQEVARQKAEIDRECDQFLHKGDLVDFSRRTAQAERNQSHHERSKLILDACKERTLDTVTAFLKHPGWRSNTNEDWGRTEQLKALRERFYANVLNVLLRTLSIYGDAKIVLELLPLLADDDLKLYKDLTKNDLSQFLLGVHTLAGHLMTD